MGKTFAVHPGETIAYLLAPQVDSQGAKKRWHWAVSYNRQLADVIHEDYAVDGTSESYFRVTAQGSTQFASTLECAGPNGTPSGCMGLTATVSLTSS